MQIFHNKENQTELVEPEAVSTEVQTEVEVQELRTQLQETLRALQQQQDQNILDDDKVQKESEKKYIDLMVKKV